MVDRVHRDYAKLFKKVRQHQQWRFGGQDQTKRCMHRLLLAELLLLCVFSFGSLVDLSYIKWV